MKSVIEYIYDHLTPQRASVYIVVIATLSSVLTAYFTAESNKTPKLYEYASEAMQELNQQYRTELSKNEKQMERMEIQISEYRAELHLQRKEIHDLYSQLADIQKMCLERSEIVAIVPKADEG